MDIWISPEDEARLQDALPLNRGWIFALLGLVGAWALAAAAMHVFEHALGYDAWQKSVMLIVMLSVLPIFHPKFVRVYLRWIPRYLERNVLGYIAVFRLTRSRDRCDLFIVRSDDEVSRALWFRNEERLGIVIPLGGWFRLSAGLQLGYRDLSQWWGVKVRKGQFPKNIDLIDRSGASWPVTPGDALHKIGGYWLEKGCMDPDFDWTHIASKSDEGIEGEFRRAVNAVAKERRQGFRLIKGEKDD